MKLYATITSERASKGQGGNKYIDVVLYRGSRDNSVEEYAITFTNETLAVYHKGIHEITIHHEEEKAKKQKDEKCEKCLACFKKENMRGNWCKYCTDELPF